MTIRSLLAFKAWADDELLDAVARVDAAWPQARHDALRILNHASVVDRIFRAHLLGEVHGFTATNTPQTPAFEVLAATIRATDAWYVDHAAGLGAADLDASVRFRFTDGDVGDLTRREILLHVVTHGGYHRGAVGQCIRGAGVAPPRDVYTRYLRRTAS